MLSNPMVLLDGFGNVFGALLAEADGVALPYSPFKTFFFISWFYLCLYSVRRSDSTLLIHDRFRYVSNVAALFIGPLHLFVLFIADTARRIQDDELDFSEVPGYTLDCILERSVQRQPL